MIFFTDVSDVHKALIFNAKLCSASQHSPASSTQRKTPHSGPNWLHVCCRIFQKYIFQR